MISIFESQWINLNEYGTFEYFPSGNKCVRRIHFTHFICLHSWSRSSSNYLQVVTVDAGRNVYWRVNLVFQFLAQLLWSDRRIQSLHSALSHMLISCSVLPMLLNKTPTYLNSSTCQYTTSNSTLFWLKTMVLDVEVLILISATSHSAVNRFRESWRSRPDEDYIICRKPRLSPEATRPDPLNIY